MNDSVHCLDVLCQSNSRSVILLWMDTTTSSNVVCWNYMNKYQLSSTATIGNTWIYQKHNVGATQIFSMSCFGLEVKKWAGRIHRNVWHTCSVLFLFWYDLNCILSIWTSYICSVKVVLITLWCRCTIELAHIWLHHFFSMTLFTFIVRKTFIENTTRQKLTPPHMNTHRSDDTR